VSIVSLILVALALNMDAFGVGIAYGMRRIRLPFVSLLLVCLISMAAISISMAAGHLISRLVPSVVSHYLGGGILVFIGVWVLYQYFRQKRVPSPENINQYGSRERGGCMELQPEPILKMHFGRFVIQILREPHTADIDMSGTIFGLEAFLLGVSLAVDSLGAGVAVAMLGFEIVVTALFVGVGHFLAMYAGLSVGKNLHRSLIGRQLAVMPGVILIFLGIMKTLKF